jgi:hypothetical protein
MQPSPYLLGQALAIVGLLGGAIEYVEIVKRRALARRQAAIREEAGDVGLRGLVRVLLTEDQSNPKP